MYPYIPVMSRGSLDYITNGRRTEYLTVPNPIDNPSGLLSDYYVGQRLGEIWGYSTDGYFQSDEEASNHAIDQTFVNGQIQSVPGEWGKLRAGDQKFADLNGNGVINNGKNTVDDHGDLHLIGNTQPRYTAGLFYPPPMVS